MDNNDILYDSFSCFAEICMCELNVLITFHYMIFKSELNFI